MKNNKLQHRYIVIVLFLIIAIDTMGISLAWPVFGSLFTSKSSILFGNNISMQWRNILYGFTMGISSLFMFLGAPILGDISDHIGRYKVLFLCLIGTSIGMGISILGVIFNQVSLLIFSRAWLGTIAASQIIAQAMIIDISNQNNKAFLLGIISTANNLGFLIGPIIGGLLMDNSLNNWFSFSTPFIFAAILALFSALLLLTTYKKNYNNPNNFIRRKWHFTNSIKVFIRALKHKKIRFLALIYACFQIGWAFYLYTIFLSLIQQYNYSGRLLGCFSLSMGLIFCFNSLITIRIITRIIKPKTIIYIALSLAAICCILTTYSNELGVWLCLFPMICAISLGGNAIVTTFSNIAIETEQGWAMGVSNSITALSWAIAPLLAGLLLAFNFSMPLFIASILFFVGTTVTILTISS